MKRSAPVSVIVWLAERALLDDALVGDMLEAYRRDGSRLRLAREFVGAIGSRIFSQANDHRLLAIRAIALGWLLQIGLGAVTRSSLMYLAHWGYSAELWLDQLLGFAVLPPLVLATNVAGSLLIGWLVSRLHRPYGPSMTMLYVGALLLFMVGGLVNSLPRMMTWESAPTIAFQTAFSLVVIPACIMTGAFASAARSRPQSS